MLCSLLRFILSLILQDIAYLLETYSQKTDLTMTDFDKRQIRQYAKDPLSLVKWRSLEKQF